MRHFIICALFLGACAPISTVDSAEVDAGIRFYEAFQDGRFAKAKKIADQFKIDRRVVWDTVEKAMWKMGQHPSRVKSVKKLGRLFQLPRERELSFARNFFNQAIVNRYCEKAVSIAFHFDLGAKRIDEGIGCAVEHSLFFSFAEDVPRIACTTRGTPEFLEQLMDTWVQDFRATSPSFRIHSSMREIASLCPFNDKHLLDLFTIGLADKKPDFALAMLQMSKASGFFLRYDVLYRRLYEMTIGLPYDLYNLKTANRILGERDFIKTPADYDQFIALAISRFHCEIALASAMEHRLPNDKIRSIFFHQRCLSADLKEFDFDVVRPEQAGWLFETSLQAGRFLFARNLVSKFSMGQDAIRRIVDEAWFAKDFDTLMELDPPFNISQRDFRESLLEKMLDSDEEWFVARYVIAQGGNPETGYTKWSYWYNWLERAYMHALYRGAYELAADIAGKHILRAWSVWAVQLAFDQAMKNNDPESAKIIAKRWNLGNDAVHQAVLLGWKKVQAESREEDRRRQKRSCKSVDAWSVERCK